jgi:DNA-binding transcriptional LysR family regulator
MKMDLPGLQMLVAAIEAKSLSKAAERENLATSAASKRIAELERRLGTTLLVRHGRGVEPTPAGAALYHRAKAILRSVELAQNSVAEFGMSGQPKIRLAANRSSIIQFLPQALSRYYVSEPNVQIELQERYSYDIPRLIADADSDIGIYHAVTPAIASCWSCRSTTHSPRTTKQRSKRQRTIRSSAIFRDTHMRRFCRSLKTGCRDRSMFASKFRTTKHAAA